MDNQGVSFVLGVLFLIYNACVCTHVHVCEHVHVHMCKHTHVLMRVLVLVHAHMCLSVYMASCTCIQMPEKSHKSIFLKLELKVVVNLVL